MSYILIVVIFSHVYGGVNTSVSVTRGMTQKECYEAKDVIQGISGKEVERVLSWCVPVNTAELWRHR